MLAMLKNCAKCIPFSCEILGFLLRLAELEFSSWIASFHAVCTKLLICASGILSIARLFEFRLMRPSGPVNFRYAKSPCERRQINLKLADQHEPQRLFKPAAASVSPGC